MKKLAIITTHPIQYNAPLFRLLSERKKIQVKVFYTWGEDALKDKFDPGFGKVIAWDIPLLEGYDHSFVINTALDKGSHHYKGIVNPSLIKMTDAWQPDAVLVYGWSFDSHFKLMRYYKNRIPVWFRGDSTLLNKSSWLAKIKRKYFLRFVYRYVNKAFYVGTNNFDYFRYAGLKKDQLIYAPHVVDNDRFGKEDDDRKNRAAGFRLKMGIPLTDTVLLYAGKFINEKDPLIIPAAFNAALLPDNVHLVLVGNGPLEETIRQSCKAVANIHFMNFQNQGSMPALYEMADVFVLSSKSETWGLAVNEAMANGTAVLVSDQCGCAPDLVHEGVNGYIFKAGDVEMLSGKMKLIVSGSDRLQKMKSASKELASRFSLEKVAGIIEKELNQ